MLTSIFLSNDQSFFKYLNSNLSIYLSIYLLIYLSIFSSICLHLSPLSVNLAYVYIYTFYFISNLSFYLSFCLLICLPVYPSICLSLGLSISSFVICLSSLKWSKNVHPCSVWKTSPPGVRLLSLCPPSPFPWLSKGEKEFLISVADPDPFQTIWIRIAPKTDQNHEI